MRPIVRSGLEPAARGQREIRLQSRGDCFDRGVLPPVDVPKDYPLVARSA